MTIRIPNAARAAGSHAGNVRVGGQPVIPALLRQHVEPPPPDTIPPPPPPEMPARPEGQPVEVPQPEPTSPPPAGAAAQAPAALAAG